ncbi:MAG: MmgE/PrpD family protein [Dehalococcoidales bacterium]
MSISQQFAAKVVKTGFSSLDELTVSRARWRILDALGCLIAGANAPGCGAMLALVKNWGGATESTVLVHGVKAPAAHAAMMNSLMTRSFDFEPVDAEGFNKSSPAHISGTTVPTALAVAEWKGASGKELITALVSGDDVAARLSVASGFDFELGWDNTGTINAFGATAVAGKLLGLDEKQLHNAFGIVLNQLAGSMDGVYDKTMCFKLPIALSARNGIFSAELAKEGFGGVKDPFTGAHGFFHNYCKNVDLSDLDKELGRRFFADAIIKPYSACRGTHSSIDSALKIARAHEYKPADIEKIEVLVTPGTLKGFCGQPLEFGETPQVDATFSIRYTVARALLRKEVKPDYMTEAAIRDPAIAALISKMSLVPSIPPEKGQATEILVTMKSGEVFSASTDFPTGHYVKTPLTDEQLKAKFRNNIAYSKTISVKKAEKALDIILKLEQLKDIRELTGLLVK